MKNSMKNWYIILIFTGVIGGFFGIRDAMKAHYLQKETITFNPVSYIFMPKEWQELVKKPNKWSDDFAINGCLKNYIFSSGKLSIAEKSHERIKLFEGSWVDHRAKVQAFKPTTEIVYVKRIAISPDMVMMSPATYHERYSGNRSEASGRGADKERLHLFYLSDGEIIKASARTNSEWLAVSMGQKIKKTQRMFLSFDGCYSIECLSSQTRFRYARGIDGWVETGCWRAPYICEEIKTEYTPIFFN